MRILPGPGVIKLEMNFAAFLHSLPGMRRKRYNGATRSEYNGKSIGDIMEMTVEEAADFFGAHPKIRRALRLMVETGLGYLKLGQPSPTLSGGEAQRIKLVSQLARRATAAAEVKRAVVASRLSTFWKNQPLACTPMMSPS